MKDGMIDLYVPFEEKDAAKALGAKWNPTEKRWQIPESADSTKFSKWLGSAPGKGPITDALYVDLIPRGVWFSNLRSEILPEEWTAAKRKAYGRASYLCQACGGKGPAHPVEAHERWYFDPESGVQRLMKIVALCPACHEATHFGLANVKGRSAQALAHLKEVNGWTQDEAEEHVNEAFRIWEERSGMAWKLDLTWLESFVELSADTKKRIAGCASGKAERTAPEDWQRDIIDGGDDDLLNHLLHG